VVGTVEAGAHENVLSHFGWLDAERKRPVRARVDRELTPASRARGQSGIARHLEEQAITQAGDRSIGRDENDPLIARLRMPGASGSEAEGEGERAKPLHFAPSG
jgi:hypothetical protein